MSAVATRVATSGAGVNPWLVAILVAFASFMEVMDSTIANVVLPYIAGDMGVSTDEASWVVTTYLVSNSISLTASSFLAERLGRKAFFLTCLGLFTLSSALCAQAWNLDSLLIFRLLQGLAGGGMVPVAQSILADTFPPAKRGQAFAVFGVAVVVAPVIGPTLGGWLADTATWRWCFVINVPTGLLAMGLGALLLQDPEGTAEGRTRARRAGFDVVGFVLVATFLGALELMLDRGLDDDWFGSSFIVGTAIVCAVAFASMIPWELNHRNPAVDLRMLGNRHFGTCFVIMLMTGAILLGNIQYVSLLVQEELGYTATLAGLVLSPGGLVTMAMMILVGRLSGSVQPKYLIMAGGLLLAMSAYDLTQVYGGLSFWFLVRSRILMGVGQPLFFLPVMTAAFALIPRDKTDQASAMINAARNIGGSIGIALLSNVVAHREQFHQSRLVEHVIPSLAPYQTTLQRATDYFLAQGSLVSQAKQQAFAWIAGQVQTQASYMAFTDAFWMLTLIPLAGALLALTLRKVPLGGDGPAIG